MDVVKRIYDLMDARGWSEYKLSVEAGLSMSTIVNLRRRNTQPSVRTIEAICTAFGISLSQFFNENMDAMPMNQEQIDFFNKWISLTSNQKRIFYELVDEMK